MNKRICDMCKEVQSEWSLLCAGCGHSTFTAVREAVKYQARSDIILTTLPTVPGYNITILKGLVFAAGNAAFTLEGTASKAGTAMDKAEEQLRSEAVRLGGNAVVGVAFSMDGAGNSINRSQTITLIGTAVVVKINSELT